jgi:hypothetical protein
MIRERKKASLSIYTIGGFEGEINLKNLIFGRVVLCGMVILSYWIP